MLGLVGGLESPKVAFGEGLGCDNMCRMHGVLWSKCWKKDSEGQVLSSSCQCGKQAEKGVGLVYGTTMEHSRHHGVFGAH